jgi:hypothetical protein
MLYSRYCENISAKIGEDGVPVATLLPICSNLCWTGSNFVVVRYLLYRSPNYIALCVLIFQYGLYYIGFEVGEYFMLVYMLDVSKEHICVSMAMCKCCKSVKRCSVFFMLHVQGNCFILLFPLGM